MICTSDSYVPHTNASIMGVLSHALGTPCGKKRSDNVFHMAPFTNLVYRVPHLSGRACAVVVDVDLRAPARQSDSEQRNYDMNAVYCFVHSI